MFEPLEVQALVRRAAFRALLSGGVADHDALASRTGLSVERVRGAISSLADGALVQVDQDGRVITAAGVTEKATGHRIVLDGVDLHTMCAIDALGIPAALGKDALVQTTCGQCGRPITLEVKAGGVEGDEGLVAWDPATDAGCDVYEAYCPEANVFCGVEHSGLWRSAAGDPLGRVLTIRDVEDLGREWWGPLA